jgi:hypothetical protein
MQGVFFVTARASIILLKNNQSHQYENGRNGPAERPYARIDQRYANSSMRLCGRTTANALWRSHHRLIRSQFFPAGIYFSAAVDAAILTLFQRLDGNGDGYITAADFAPVNAWQV